MEAARQNGEVVQWNDARGFGFIQPDDGAADVFVSYAVIAGGERLAVGDRVEFEAFSTPRGMRASVAKRMA